MTKTTYPVVGVVVTALRPFAFAAVALAATSSTASAQLNNLEDRAFIDALHGRGMIHVMNHFMTTSQTKDPILTLQLRITAAKAAATKTINRANPAAVEARQDAAVKVGELYRDLFQKAPQNHWELPLWKTDYCDWILGTLLPDRYVYAHLFVQHGRPTTTPPSHRTDIDNQQEAYDSLVREVFNLMREAAFEHREIEFQMSRDPNFQRKWVNSGRWDKLHNEYGQILLPFQQAKAIYHAHFMTIPAGNLTEADGLLRGVMAQELMRVTKPSPAILDFRQHAYSLAGRIALRKKAYRTSIMHLNAAINRTDPVAASSPATAEPHIDAAQSARAIILFESKLAKAYAYAGSERKPEALAMLADMRRGQPARGNAMLLILLADAQFRIDGADEKAKKHYQSMLQSPEARPSRRWIERFLARRDGIRTPNLQDKDVDRFLASVRLLLDSASDARSPQNTPQALEIYKKADHFLNEFLARRHKELNPTQLGQGWTMRGWTQFHMSQLDATRRTDLKIAAIRSFLNGATAYDGHNNGEEGLKPALILYRQVKHTSQARRPLAKTMDHGYKLLFSKYNRGEFQQSSWFTHQHYYYGDFLTAQGQWGKAFSQLNTVPHDHPLYGDAQYLQVRCAHNLWIDSNEQKPKARWATEVRNLTDRVLRDLRAQIDKARSSDAPNLPTLRRIEAKVKLNAAEVAYEQFRQTARAKGYLHNFKELYADFTPLLIRKQRVSIAVAIQNGDLDTARNNIAQLVKANPDQARQVAAGLIPTLLRQAKTLHSAEKPQAATTITDYALSLVRDTMIPIAKQQNNRLRVKNYEILLAQVLFAARKTEQARDSFVSLNKRYTRSLKVKKGLFDCLYELKDEAKARKLGLALDNAQKHKATEGTLNAAEQRIYWDTLWKLMTLWDRQFERLTKNARTDIERRAAQNYGARIFKFLQNKFEAHGKTFGPPFVNKKLGSLHAKYRRLR